MKQLIALAVVALAWQIVSASAGEEAVVSSKEVAAPPPPPTSYFRSNEFSQPYLGVAIEGDPFNGIPGAFCGSTVTGNAILRYPLDITFPGLHLAPYVFGGVGGIFNESNTFSQVATFGNSVHLNRSGSRDEGPVGIPEVVLNTASHRTLACFLTLAIIGSTDRETTSC